MKRHLESDQVFYCITVFLVQNLKVPLGTAAQLLDLDDHPKSIPSSCAIMLSLCYLTHGDCPFPQPQCWVHPLNETGVKGMQVRHPVGDVIEGQDPGFIIQENPDALGCLLDLDWDPLSVVKGPVFQVEPLDTPRHSVPPQPAQLRVSLSLERRVGGPDPPPLPSLEQIHLPVMTPSKEGISAQDLPQLVEPLWVAGVKLSPPADTC